MVEEITFRERLKIFAKDVHGGVHRLAATCDINPHQLSKYIMGLTKPHWDVVVKLNEQGGLSIDWLITGKGDMVTERGASSVQAIEGTLQEASDKIAEAVQLLRSV